MNDTHILIDRLVHSENKNEIVEILKKLLPDATEFTTNLYAYYTEFQEDSLLDKFMDIESDVERKIFWQKNYSSYGEEFLKNIPHIPLTSDDRLYKLRRLSVNAPQPKNQNLDDDFEYNTPIDKYIVQAMIFNHELDRSAAENLVLSEIEKSYSSALEKKQAHSSDNDSPLTDNEKFFLFLLTETNYMKRNNFFIQKLNPSYDEEDIIDSGYIYILETIKSIVDPNYNIRSIIATDVHFQILVDEMKNDT